MKFILNIDLDGRKVIALPAPNPNTGIIEESPLFKTEEVEIEVTVFGCEPSKHIVKLP